MIIYFLDCFNSQRDSNNVQIVMINCWNYKYAQIYKYSNILIILVYAQNWYGDSTAVPAAFLLLYPNNSEIS